MTSKTDAAGGAVVPLTAADLIERPDAEPLIADLVLAERLGFGRPRAIRDIIERHREELETLGPLVKTIDGLPPHDVAVMPDDGLPRRGVAVMPDDELPPHGAAVIPKRRRGRPPASHAAYRLTQHQALLVTTYSRTPRAAALRKEIFDVYLAWRAGRLRPSAEAPTGATVAMPAELVARMFSTLDRLSAAFEGVELRPAPAERAPRPRPAAAVAPIAQPAEDVFGQFLVDRTVHAPGERVQSRKLYSAWTAYLAGRGITKEAERTFGMRLKERGIASTKSDCIFYLDLALLEFKSIAGAQLAPPLLDLPLIENVEPPAAPASVVGLLAAPVTNAPPIPPAAYALPPAADVIYGWAAIGAFLGMTARQAEYRLKHGLGPVFVVGRKIAARRTSLTAWLGQVEHAGAH